MIIKGIDYRIAETREEAMRNARFGFYKWFEYFQRINPARFVSLPKGDPLEILVAARGIVVGTPEDAIAQIDRLYAKQGQFGAFLQSESARYARVVKEAGVKAE